MKKLIAISLPLLLFFSACGSSAPKPATSSKDFPDWFLNPPQNKDMFYGAGSAMRPQLNLSKKIATARARDELARQISTQVNSVLKDFEKSVGVGMDAQATEVNESALSNTLSRSLQNSRIEKAEMINGTMFVLVSYNATEAAEAAKAAAKATADRIKAYKEELDANKAWDDLEKSFAKMEGSSGASSETDQ
jgi:hypothetical protein